MLFIYSKTCLKRPLKKKTKIGFQECRSKELQNAPREHSAILSTFIKLPFVFKTYVLSTFEWWLKTGFTVCDFSGWIVVFLSAGIFCLIRVISQIDQYWKLFKLCHYLIFCCEEKNPSLFVTTIIIMA